MTSQAPKTNKKQYERMVELLNTRSDIAQGFSKVGKQEVNSFWSNLAEELNSIGRPKKDASAWRKVWLDYKAYIKRKLSHNKKETKSTGGGPSKLYTFNAMEETVIRITGLEKSVSGIPNTKSFGLATQEPQPDLSRDNDLNLDISMSSIDIFPSSEETLCIDVAQEEEFTANLSRPSRVSIKNQPKENTFSLLKTQVEIQKKLYESIDSLVKRQEEYNNEMCGHMKKLYRNVNNLYEVEKEKLKELRRHNKHNEELILKKIEIKMQILDIKKSKLE